MKNKDETSDTDSGIIVQSGEWVIGGIPACTDAMPTLSHRLIPKSTSLKKNDGSVGGLPSALGLQVTLDWEQKIRLLAVIAAVWDCGQWDQSTAVKKIPVWLALWWLHVRAASFHLDDDATWSIQIEMSKISESDWNLSIGDLLRGNDINNVVSFLRTGVVGCSRLLLLSTIITGPLKYHALFLQYNWSSTRRELFKDPNSLPWNTGKLLQRGNTSLLLWTSGLLGRGDISLATLDFFTFFLHAWSFPVLIRYKIYFY